MAVVSEADVTEEWQYEPRPEVIRLEDVPLLRSPQSQEPIRYLPDFGPDWVCSCTVQKLADGRTARVLTEEPRLEPRQAWIVVQVPACDLGPLIGGVVRATGGGAAAGAVDGLLPAPSSPLDLVLSGDEVWPLWSDSPTSVPQSSHRMIGCELAVRLAHRDAVLIRVGRSFGLVFPPDCSSQAMLETFVVAGFLPPVDFGLDPWEQSQEAVWLAHFRAQAQSAAAQKLAMEMASRRYRDMFGVAPQQRLAELQAGR